MQNYLSTFNLTFNRTGPLPQIVHLLRVNPYNYQNTTEQQYLDQEFIMQNLHDIQLLHRPEMRYTLPVTGGSIIITVPARYRSSLSDPGRAGRKKTLAGIHNGQS